MVGGPTHTANNRTPTDTACHVLRLFDLDNEADTRERVFLPVRNGGMGIISLAGTAHPAFTGSWALVGDAVRHLLGDTITVHSDWYEPIPAQPVPRMLSELAHSVRQLQQTNSLANVSPETWILTSQSQVQMAISHNLSVAKSDHILSGLQSPVMRASFLGCRSPESGAWVDASPCHRWARITDAVFRGAAKTRLSIHSPAIDYTCECTTKGSSAAFPHSFYCHRYARKRLWRHNLIRDTLLEGLRRIPNTLTVSEPHVSDHWHQHDANAPLGACRGDVWINSDGGNFPFCAMLDVTVRTPATTMAGLGTKPRLTAEVGYRDKHAHYVTQWVVPRGQLHPIALEPTGALASASLEFFQLAARCVAATNTQEYVCFLRELLMRTSVALQRGNAAMLQRGHLPVTVAAGADTLA